MNKGASLLEVLVAMLVISLGIMGLLSLQMTSLHRTYSAYWQSIANVQLYSFLEVLRSNTSDEVRQNELPLWNQQNAHLLPKGIGFYHCENAVCSVNINWQEQTPHSMSLSSRL